MKTREFMLIIMIFPLLLCANQPHKSSIDKPNLSKSYFSNILFAGAVINPNLRLRERFYENDYDESGELDLTTKDVFYYDSQNPERVIRKDTQGYSNGLHLEYYYLYSYDDSGEYRLRADHYYPGNTYTGMYFEYNYDNDYKLTSYLQYFGDYPNYYPEAWRYYQYNDIGISQFTSRNATEPYLRHTYANDGQGRIITDEFKTAYDTLNWINDSVEEIIYKDDDFTSGLDQIRDVSHTPFRDYVIPGNIFGNIALRVVRRWTENNVYVDSLAYSYHYNEDNQLESIFVIKCGMFWKNYQKISFEYDADTNIETITKSVWKTPEFLWLPVIVSHYVWEQYTSIQDESDIPANKLMLSAYPNPFYNEVNITFDSKNPLLVNVSVYNVKGQLVRKMGDISTNTFIWDGKDGKGLSVVNGIYFIKAVQSGQTITRKIIKVK